jgi:potassium channel subfamily K
VIKANESYGEMRQRLMRKMENEKQADSTNADLGTDTEGIQEELHEAEKRMLSEYNEAERIAKLRDAEAQRHKQQRQPSDSSGDTHMGSEGSAETSQAEKAAHNLEGDLLKQLLELVIKLEAESRDLLLESMDHSIARTLLLADRNGKSGHVCSVGSS